MVVATSAVIAPTQASIAYAISTIFLYNAIAGLLFPFVGHLLDLSQNAFGLWAGTAINDTSSVVGAGYTYGMAAGDYAVIVKLTRTTMIIPMVLIIALFHLRAKRQQMAADTAARVPGCLGERLFRGSSSGSSWPWVSARWASFPTLPRTPQECLLE